MAQEREISCLFLLSMLPIWFPITSNSNQQQRRGDLRESVCVRGRAEEGEKEGQGSEKKEGVENSGEEEKNSEGCSVRERADKIT